MKPLIAKWSLPGLLLVCAFLADFSTKVWVNSNLQLGVPQDFLPGILRLMLTRNTGGAWGIGKENALFMTVLASSIVLGILFWIWSREKSEHPMSALERCGVALIVGGASGNLLDRFTRGEVTDFLQFTFFDFPVFNVGDALIDVGAGLIVLCALFFSKSINDEHGTKGPNCKHDEHTHGQNCKHDSAAPADQKHSGESDKDD